MKICILYKGIEYSRLRNTVSKDSDPLVIGDLKEEPKEDILRTELRA